MGNDRALQQLTLAACAADPVLWINDWCWTYDPREAVAVRPFSLFPRQAEFIHWLQERALNQEDGIAEKCRDVGFTWLCCSYALWCWLFHEGESIGFGSRKLELVDKIGDPDSIFEKLRILLRNLPSWMVPPGFSWGEHDNFAKLLNPANGNTITGEGGDNIGRGGRKSKYFVDEAAFLERAQKVVAALSQNSRCKIWVSTPNGPGNQFARMRFGGKIPVFTFRWQDDPRKGDAWYQHQKAILDPVTVAQEIDIDYNASIEGVTIPGAWVQAAVDFDKWLLEAKGEVLPANGDPRGGLDIADEGKDKCVLISGRGPSVEKIVAWGQLNTTQTAWRARDEAEKLQISNLNYDCIGVGAGVKGTWKSAEVALPFQVHPVNAGSAPSHRIWPSGKTSQDLFLNLRAEMWWLLRVRFEKTFEYREQGIEHPLTDLISIPNSPELIADLSLPLSETTENGKIRIESKEKMRARGVKSPDYGDALALLFAPGPIVAKVF